MAGGKSIVKPGVDAKTGWLLLGLAGAVLVPLYGNPRDSTVSHAEWGRMLAAGLDLDSALTPRSPASLVFSILSWKASLKQRGEDYLRADGTALLGQPARLQAVADPAEAAYALAVARAGDYRIRVRLAGSPQSTAALELTHGTQAKSYTFSVRPPAQEAWVEAGVAHLSPGGWTAALSMPAGTELESLEIAPPCLSPVEPLEGWRAPRTTDNVDLAVTVLRALDEEAELAPSDTALEIPARDFQAESGQLELASLDPELQGYQVSSGARGLKVSVLARIPEAGLYTVRFFGQRGAGQRWTADGCRKIIVCTDEQSASGPGWQTLGSVAFAAGAHQFAVALGPGASLQRLRLERRRDAGNDYVEALRRLGFDPGPEGPVTRAKAEEALDFLRRRRTERPTPDCGDWDVPREEVRYASAAGPATPGTFGGGRPGTPGTGNPPLTPPAVPPQIPASPVEP